MFFDIILIADIWTVIENIVIYEYIFPALSLFFLLAVMSPTQWKVNWIILVISMVYFGFKIYIRDGEIPVTFYESMTGTFFYFFITSISLNRKVKDLYSSIQKCEKLIEEQKRILKFFPDSVIIQHKFDDSECKTIFSNNEFDTQIMKIRNQVNELEDIKVWFSKSELEESETIQTSLSKLLVEHQLILQNSETVNQQKVTIWCKKFVGVGRQLNDSNDSDENFIKIFSIKSMKVNWEDKNWFMHVFIDTTDIVKLEEAKNNIRWQKIMFANASHEFRTPLNAIMNSYKLISSIFDELMKDVVPLWTENRMVESITYQSQLIKKFVNIGNNSSTVLTSLIEDILDLSKIEAGTFSTCISSFWVADTVVQVFQIFESQCKAKHIELVREVEDRLTKTKILSDEGRIKQVLLNTVSNAYKFTFEGTISISVGIIDEFVEFWVKDSGVGIKEEDFGKLFTLFGMLDWNREINPHGCGIGLTVSKKFIELLGGSIWIESKYGVGTSVHFRIPFYHHLEPLNNQFEHNCDISCSWSPSHASHSYVLHKNISRPFLATCATRKISWK